MTVAIINKSLKMGGTGGSLLIFFTRPISGAISAVALFFFALPVITPYWRRLRGLPVRAGAHQET